MIAAISAKLKAGRPAKPRENPFELEGIPHPELFTPEQRYALRESRYLSKGISKGAQHASTHADGS